MENAQVGIIMGSDSDLTVMKAAADVLEAEFGIASSVTALSAHRAPEEVAAYARTAGEQGLKVIIAGAGVAAHLPGVIAAFTPLPVIGVPIKSSATAGIDSLFAIAQMPPGVPVATVAINGAKNAGILAAEMIGTGDAAVREKVMAYKEKMRDEVVGKAEKMQEYGFKKYMEENGLA
ncbi:MAG: 5-(carboxyamino)imidazole ribonucleotide mutase [Patescibacteria group bacterium]|nr:5-(carboxyamino)imidazole ribonucleotide mutase [Patescibacteria group bacterium]